MDEDLQEFREHVERALREACGVDDLVSDEDGDWPVDVEGVPVFVSLVEEPHPHVHVFSRIASAVGSDAWAELNHLNVVMMWAKLVLWDNGDVFAGARIHPAGVSAEVLDATLEAIAEYARDCGPMLEAVYGVDADAEPQQRTTPEQITALPPGGVFVFGSGAEGRHSGGAARLAYERFGAEQGVGEGLRGDSYAIPTMKGFDELRAAAARFVAFAAAHPELEFWLTRVGCGHAGLDEASVSALFAETPDNVVKPKGW